MPSRTKPDMWCNSCNRPIAARWSGNFGLSGRPIGGTKWYCARCGSTNVTTRSQAARASNKRIDELRLDLVQLEAEGRRSTGPTGEKTYYMVVITELPNRWWARFKLRSLVAAWTDGDLSTPKVVAHNLPEPTANTLRQRLEQHGARVDMKAYSSPIP
jgi:hypothetical protein